MHGRAVGIAGNVGQTRHCLEDTGETRLGGVRTGLPKCRGAQNDQVRVGLPQGFLVQAPLGQRAGAEILQQDIEFRQHFQQQFGAFGPAQIQGDEILVAVGGLPPYGLAILEGREVAQAVPGARQFRFHHIGAEIRHQGAGKGGC